MIKHILCPVALESEMHIALKRSVIWAHQLKARITLLNVHPEFMSREEMEMLRVKMMEQFRETSLAAKQKMKELVEKFGAGDLQVDYLLREGKPGDVIPEVAEEIGADLIVMYTKGRDTLKEFITGTISQQVINQAPCPVLVIPHHEK
ncbi:MAG: universal stress protein [FCB group bacterium]|nr:universal stress protein [FCB group bacterium]